MCPVVLLLLLLLRVGHMSTKPAARQCSYVYIYIAFAIERYKTVCVSGCAVFQNIFRVYQLGHPKSNKCVISARESSIPVHDKILYMYGLHIL